MELLRSGPPDLLLSIQGIPTDQLHQPDALIAAATAVASSNIKLPSGLSVYYEIAAVSSATTTAVTACQLWFEVRISRDNLLEDLLTSLQNTLLEDPSVLRLPLRSVLIEYTFNKSTSEIH